MNLFFQKFWLFFKKNWGYIVVLIGALISIAFFKKDRSSLLEELRTIRDSYEKQIKEIDKIHQEERKKNTEALLLLQKRLSEIQKQYDDAKVELDKKKKAEVEDLMKKYQDDPDTLAKKLSDLTGFKVILPE